MGRCGAMLALLATAAWACGEDHPDVPYPSTADRSQFPGGPYGLAAHDAIANYTFDTVHGTLSLQDLRHDPARRLLVVFSVQTWPNACAAEARYLSSAYEDYARRGIEVVGALVENYDNRPTADAARDYFELLHAARYPYGADDWDREPSLGQDLEAVGLGVSPVNLVVDLDTMEITARVIGWNADELESHLIYFR